MTAGVLRDRERAREGDGKADEKHREGGDG